MSNVKSEIASPHAKSSGHHLGVLEILGDRTVLRPIRAARLDRDLQALYLQCFLLLVCEVVLTKCDFGSGEPGIVSVIISSWSPNVLSTYHFRASM
jgi:hypothetical protein